MVSSLQTLVCIFQPFCSSSQAEMGRAKRIWYLSPMRAAKVQASLRIRAVSPEPSLLAHTSSESRGTFRQKARSLAPLNGWACAVKVCHDGMLEDTNSLGAAEIWFPNYETLLLCQRFGPLSNLQNSNLQSCLSITATAKFFRKIAGPGTIHCTKIEQKINYKNWKLLFFHFTERWMIKLKCTFLHEALLTLCKVHFGFFIHISLKWKQINIQFLNL